MDASPSRLGVRTAAEALLDNEAWDELITVFAPIDEAFDGQDLAVLRNNRIPHDFVNRHIAPGEFYQEDLGSLVRLSMLNGRFIDISVDGDAVSIGNAPIIEIDMYGHNGLAHAVEKYSSTRGTGTRNMPRRWPAQSCPRPTGIRQ